LPDKGVGLEETFSTPKHTSKIKITFIITTTRSSGIFINPPDLIRPVKCLGIRGMAYEHCPDYQNAEKKKYFFHDAVTERKIFTRMLLLRRNYAGLQDGVVQV